MLLASSHIQVRSLGVYSYLSRRIDGRTDTLRDCVLSQGHTPIQWHSKDVGISLLETRTTLFIPTVRLGSKQQRWRRVRQWLHELALEVAPTCCSVTWVLPVWNSVS